MPWAPLGRPRPRRRPACAPHAHRPPAPAPALRQLQQMAGIPYAMAYGNGGMHSSMAFFGGGGVN